MGGASEQLLRDLTRAGIYPIKGETERLESYRDCPFVIQDEDTGHRYAVWTKRGANLMERIIDVLPIIMLGVGQLMLAMVCMNQTKRIEQLEKTTGLVIPWEALNGKQE